MKIAVASDHAGYKMKEFIKGMLVEMGHEIEDFGSESEQSTDYPDHGRPAAEAVSRGDADRVVLVCGTGIGMSMVANKVRGVRAALAGDPFSARMARAHNDANALVLGSRVIGEGMAAEILHIFLNTDFEGGRHLRRLDKIEKRI